MDDILVVYIQSVHGHREECTDANPNPTRWAPQMVGSYYCYDNPSALNKQMEEYFTAQVDKPMSRDEYQTNFNLLYTVYSIPNIVLPFFGGYFTDLWGARVVNIICASFILCGQVVVAVGAYAQMFPLMIAGRVVFGFGGESLCVSQVCPCLLSRLRSTTDSALPVPRSAVPASDLVLCGSAAPSLL